jgi:hypothetical protein
MQPLLGMAMTTLLVGADPRVVRAALMEGLSAIAVPLGRGEPRHTPSCIVRSHDLIYNAVHRLISSVHPGSYP